ncbi:MAG: hypothetical protein EXR68_00055 [Dehalococcoidia bacterium]|nr:hypothetical protein [Dehalococcoidia bacterium]
MRVAWPMALLVVAAVLGVTLIADPRTAHAQAVQPGQTTVTSKDPASISFSMRVRAPGGVKSARLEYSVQNATSGAVGGGGEAQLTPGVETDLNFSLSTRDGQRYIPIGSIFKYFWSIVPNDGSPTTTPVQEYLFVDGRYTWSAVTDPGVTVYYYGANETAAQVALRAARSSLDATGVLLGVKVGYPIRLFVYRSEDEGKLAMRPQSPTFDAQIRTGGQRVSADVLHIFDNVSDPDVIRHEVAHVVTHVAGDGPFSGVPSWLDEGTAVYMQKDLGIGYRTAVNLAIQSDRALLLRAMQSSPGKPEDVNVFYGQAWSIVKFMNDEFGQPKFVQLYATIKEGARIDDAVRKVYGFDQDGLYNAWRQKNGLKPVAVSAQPEVVIVPSTQATRVPLGVSSGGGSVAATAEAGSTSSGSTASADAESPRGMVEVVLGVTLLIAGVLGGGGFYLLRQRGGGTVS